MAVLLVLHLVAGVALMCGARRTGRRAFAFAAVAPAAALAYAVAHWSDVVDGAPVEQRIEWVPGLALALDLRLDALALVMVLLIAGIGVLVCAYAAHYFAPTVESGRIAGLLVLFAGSMLGVVLSDHTLGLLVFWELTTVTSYLLIGHDDQNARARAAALQALLVTGGGGLALFAGLVVAGRAAGTYRISELTAAPEVTTAVGVALACILLGAFTKSAQVPFAGWLPGAMVAPTPISAYLHSATMVKAGVYLVARLSPVLATSGGWRAATAVVGGTTMLVGGWRALRQVDLKLLLAFGTVSQLGFLMVLFGAGTVDLAGAGVLLLLAHGAFKAALFMVVGIVDHQVGTRDVRLLHGFPASWRPLVGVAVLAAASMAGIPPLLGFIAKEEVFAGLLDDPFTGSGIVLAVVAAGSVLTVAYSGRFVLALFGRLSAADQPVVSRTAPAPGVGFLLPAAVLSVIGLVTGLVPVLVDGIVRGAVEVLHPGSDPHHVHLWAGFGTPLVLSAIVIGLGVALVAGRQRVAKAQRQVFEIVRPVPSAERSFLGVLRGLGAFASRVTAVVQSGSLPVYAAVVLTTVMLVPVVVALPALDDLPVVVERPVHVALVGCIVLGAVSAAAIRHRLGAALALSAVGYSMAGLYVVQGAPDLALTQFAIETLATVLFVLVLRFLPPTWADRAPPSARVMRIAVATVVGASVFVLALVMSGARSDVPAPSISDEMVARALPDAKGKNVVNVILVDFRGFDTLGEITVLAVAALGTVGLARLARRRAGEVER